MYVVLKSWRAKSFRSVMSAKRSFRSLRRLLLPQLLLLLLRNIARNL